MENLLPLVCFLNGWLEEIKHKDGVYNYKDKTEALRGIFNDAPYRKYFPEEFVAEVCEMCRKVPFWFNSH
jgi:hypothetical protein